LIAGNTGTPASRIAFAVTTSANSTISRTNWRAWEDDQRHEDVIITWKK
jgi:hypothetical protein